MTSIYDQGLAPVEANYAVQTPIDFITRTASVYPDYPAIIHGAIRRTWAETHERSLRLASALVGRGIKKGDTVAVMLPNIPAMVECHFGVPMTGAVMNALNVRLDAEVIAFMIEHAEAKVILVDREFGEVILDAVSRLDKKPLIIDVDDPEYGEGVKVSDLDYEAFLQEGDPEYQWDMPTDEWDAISLNYTSGTTGNPKGVVYHHRGAYLNSLGNTAVWSMAMHPVYLWTLPMFHCNGWCFPWTITAMAGTHVCLRRVDPEKILQLIREHRVTHMCGAPIVLNALLNVPPASKAGIDHVVKAMVAGAPPPAQVIGAVEEMGIALTHTYGLTEVYGPVTVCAWKDRWNDLPLEERAAIKSRQGVRYHTLGGTMIADPGTMKPTPKDGKTIGEIFLRGNTVMKGYLKNPKATEEAFRGGWFHTGDLAVWHEDGYMEIKDRLKDIIISGGENISTIEIEDVLYRHPAVQEAAVVARPDEKWGETPCAFVTLKPEAGNVTEVEMIDFCRKHMARFKVPKTVVFSDLPKTSTGKIQKFLLRDQAKEIK
ncbi:MULTISPECIES: acyl-CoA synthetase [unclassified Marinobacter]|uniref:acyl-CoA synthetase n=1 Tax=unclassified Marinobacter TaxID=83889 RepID=UPI000BFA4885|nr:MULTISPECIES: acyl-CoA synthetase [unclassified Marinobacter]PFG09336.1 fatty-acyl-CoA synthase [Marinobacter sp. LV10MA510-1]PFG51257.1 fatty-acyl-CoA synthase [Marinobacter sp. LV10R520-4]